MAARKKTTTKKTASKPARKLTVKETVDVTPELTSRVSNPLQNPKVMKKVILVLGLLALILLAYFKKEWFISATVNGSPLTTVEVLQRLNEDYKKQVVDQMVNEKLVLQEAKKNNAIPSNDDVKAKMSEIETRFGGADNFNLLLEQQGQSRSYVERQVMLRLALEKLYSNEATVSAEEIDTYLTQNKALLTATDTDGQRKEAEDAVRQSKLDQVIFQKVEELKTNSKISTF